MVFVIEDEIHAEWQGKFARLDEAMAELDRRSGIGWDQPPNAAPCTSWKSCGRDYFVIEFDDSKTPWEEVSRVMVMKISSSGLVRFRS